MALKICCKSSSEHLGILVVAAETIKMGDFAPKGPTGYSKNSDLGGREELRGAIEKRVIEGRATERRVTERCSWWG